MIAGGDYRIKSNLFVGGAVGVKNGESDLAQNAGSVDSNDMNMTVYGTYGINDDLFIEGTLFYGVGEFDLTRNINYTANAVVTNTSARATTEGDSTGFSIGVGYQHGLPYGLDFDASATLRMASSDLDPYTESGAPGLNLAVQGQSIDSRSLSVGALVSKSFSQSWGIIQPQASILMIKELEKSGQNISAQFASDPFNTGFTYTTSNRDSSFFILGMGASAVFANDIQGFAQIETLVGYDDYEQILLTVGVRKDY